MGKCVDYELYKRNVMENIYSTVGIIVFSATLIGSFAYVFYRFATHTQTGDLMYLFPLCLVSLAVWPIVLLAGIGVVLSGPFILVSKITGRNK